MVPRGQLCTAAAVEVEVPPTEEAAAAGRKQLRRRLRSVIAAVVVCTSGQTVVFSMRLNLVLIGRLLLGVHSCS